MIDDEESDNNKYSGNCFKVNGKAKSIVNDDSQTVSDVENVAVDANDAAENVTMTKAKKRKTPKEVREAKPKNKK